MQVTVKTTLDRSCPQKLSTEAVPQKLFHRSCSQTEAGQGNLCGQLVGAASAGSFCAPTQLAAFMLGCATTGCGSAVVQDAAASTATAIRSAAQVHEHEADG